MKNIVLTFLILFVICLVGCNVNQNNIVQDVVDNKEVINEEINNDSNLDERESKEELVSIKNELLHERGLGDTTNLYYDLLLQLNAPDLLNENIGENMLAIIADNFYYEVKTDTALVYKLDVIIDIANELFSQEHVEILNQYINNKESRNIISFDYLNENTDEFILIDKENNLVAIFNFDTSYSLRAIHADITDIKEENGVYIATINTWKDFQGEGWGKNEIYDEITGEIVRLKEDAFNDLLNEYFEMTPDYTFTLKFRKNTDYTFTKFKLIDSSYIENIIGNRTDEIDSLTQKYVSNLDNIVVE